MTSRVRLSKNHTQKAIIGLEDGTILNGRYIGADSVATGELVFATPYTGYEEAMTDPSYAGQILLFTYPLIGNYGVRQEHFQSDEMQPEAIVVRECCKQPNHPDATATLDEFLRDVGKTGIEGVDTRKLTTKLRDEGVMNAAIVPNGTGEEAVKTARETTPIASRNLVDRVSCDAPYNIPGSGPRVVVVDTGIKQDILRSLKKRGLDMVVVPGTVDPGTIREYDPEAILFGNGPGDPKQAEAVFDIINTFAGEMPLFGICLGCQLLSLALGGDTYKLKFGHRGANQPVKNLETGKVHITSQNHGYAVNPDSLEETPLEPTAINPNDNTVEAVKSDYLNIHAVQYHPEAAPGPMDAESEFFDRIPEVISNAETLRH